MDIDLTRRLIQFKIISWVHESKTSNCEYVFRCMNWVVVMIAKRTVAVYKPKMRTNKRKSTLKGFKKAFFYTLGPGINEKCGQPCSNWKHWCPLCGTRLIIRTSLISFGNIWNSPVNFWISFENFWNSLGKSEYHLEISENHLDISGFDLAKV